MTRYRIAAALLIAQGALLEIGGFLATIPLLLGTTIPGYAGSTFALDYLNDNLVLVSVLGAIFGILRVTGAIGLLRNRMWGLALSVVNCAVTLALMTFMLPAGIADGVFSGSALILILTSYFGRRPVVDVPVVRQPVDNS